MCWSSTCVGCVTARARTVDAAGDGVSTMTLVKKRKLADIVIFLGMAINAVVIGLILYFYVI